MFDVIMMESQMLHKGISARQALGRLAALPPQAGASFCLTDSAGYFEGILTDASLRHGLAQGLSLDDPAVAFALSNPLTCVKGTFHAGILKAAREQGQAWVPVLDESEKVIQLLDTHHMKGYIPADVVLMAGGQGTRLRPFTEKIPKPLIEVGGRSLLAHNVRWLSRFGLTQFTVSVHYLAYLISNQLGDGTDFGVNIRYVLEDHPLGTGAALGLISSFQHDVILLMNADLLTNFDFDAFFAAFDASGADMAIATKPYSVSSNFGIVEVDSQQHLTRITEKPTFSYLANAGIYLIRRELVDLIPQNAYFDATDLIQMLLGKGKTIVSVPITQYWIDIGNPEDLMRARREIPFIPDLNG